MDRWKDGQMNGKKDGPGLPLSSCAEDWGDLRRNCKLFGGCLSKPCTKLEENWRDFRQVCSSRSYFYWLMSSNITVYSRRNTTLTIDKKWTFNMKLCNLYYIILAIYFKHYSFSEHSFYRILGHFIFLHFMTHVYYQGCL